MIEIRLLGQFGIRRNDQPVELASRPAQSLLAYLVLHAGVDHRREKLAGIIWPEATEDNARTYLRQALWRIRKTIGAEFILADRMTVAFDKNTEYWLDVKILQQPLEESWTTQSLITILDVYKGELLPGFYEDWVLLDRERLQNVFEQRIRRLLERMVDEGQWKDVLHWGERWIALGYVPEPAYRALMSAHAGRGDQAGMANVYHRCVRAMAEELGVEPSEETQLLYQQLSKGEHVPVTGAGWESRPEISLSTSTLMKMDQSLAEPAFLAANFKEIQRPEEPFVGRERELKSLESVLQQVLEGKGRVVFVTGESGQGKSTLLNEFARRAQVAHPDLIVTAGACPVYTPVCAPYGLFRAVLEMLTGDLDAALAAGIINGEQAKRLWHLMPEMIALLIQFGPHLLESLVSSEGLLVRTKASSLEPRLMERLKAIALHSQNGNSHLSHQGDLFIEYADFLITLSKRWPILVILDDLHWADPSSIGLLGHLGYRLSEGAILLACAYRPEEVYSGRGNDVHPLVPVLGEYKRRFGQVQLTLDEPTDDNGRAFIDALLDQEANTLGDEFREALTRHTNGHPLFTVELLRAMRERRALIQDEEGRWTIGPDFDWDVVPPRVEGVIETRIGQLDQDLRQWLEIASVEGEAFTAEVIAQALGLEAHAVVNQLSKEIDRKYRLVIAQGIRHTVTGRISLYQFRHNLFRHYLYNHLDDIERSYLHQQVGEALEQLFETQTQEIADQLAHHFQMAGLDDKAMIYLMQAGDYAVRAYAYDEAKDFYKQAIALAKQLSKGDKVDKELTQAFMKLGRTLEHQADVDGALSVYQEMESLSRTRDDQQMALTSLTAQGILYSIPSAIHDPKQGQAILEQALLLAQELDDRPAEARILWGLTIASEYDNQSERAIEFGERAQILARDLELRRQLAFILGDLGGCYWVVGQIARAQELFQEAAAIWREEGNLPMLADVLIQSSYASTYGGAYDEAIALTDESWQISQSIGNKWNMAFSRSRIGFVHRARGQLGRSIEAAKESLELGKIQELPNPQIFAGAELAFDYAYLGAPELGLDTANKALSVAEKVPAYRPYLWAALANNHLVSGDFERAEAVIHQALSDPYWQAYPVLCIALDIVNARLALAQENHSQGLQLAADLLGQIQRFSARAYFPEVLDLSAQALLALGHAEEARKSLIKAHDEAEAMGAKGYLWPILFHLSLLEMASEKVSRLRRDAAANIEFIAAHVGKPSLKNSFLSLPEVKAVIES